MRTVRLRKIIKKGFLAAFFAIASVSAGNALGDPFGLALFNDVKKGKEAMLMSDLSDGAKVDGRDKFGQTPLMVAVGLGRLQMEKVLIHSGADVNARDKFGQAPIMIAVRMGHLQDLILLLKSGANIHARNDQGENSLIVAARSGHVSMAKALIHSGSKIDSRDNLGQTPLMVAIQKNHPRMVDFLIKSKADVNAKNNKGVTPLMLAAINGNILETRTLIAAGSKIGMTDRHGRNALSYAQAKHNKKIMDFLKRISALPASRPVGDFSRAIPGKGSQSQDAAIRVSP